MRFDEIHAYLKAYVVPGPRGGYSLARPADQIREVGPSLAGEAELKA